VRAGLTLAQIGEFSFIVAGLGVDSGATRPLVLPVAIAVSCVTALTTPLLVRYADDLSRRVDARLPKRVQTFTTFYHAWITSLGAAPEQRRRGLWRALRRRVGLLVVDAVLLVVTVIGAALLHDRLVGWLGAYGVGERWARTLVVSAATVLAALFIFGILRLAGQLARALATHVVPAGQAGRVDLGTAPRRALLLTLELAITLVVLVPVAAVTQPFLGGGVLVFGAVALGIAFAVWRSMGNLSGHVRAGSELIVEALARQSRMPTAPAEAEAAAKAGLAEVSQLLPGFPGLLPERLTAAHAAVGRSLGELNLRAATGATVLVIQRGEAGSIMPTAGEILRTGDVLALAGTDDAVAAARALLAAGPPSEEAT
jgi:CPA2 family monovalent cation:H+ antiporter-2